MSTKAWADPRWHNGKQIVWVCCPTCKGIVHIEDVDFPAKVSPSPSGKELRIWMECESGHRFAIELEDHSGCMSLATVRVRTARKST